MRRDGGISINPFMDPPQVDDRLGGAPANVACGLARLGTAVAFLGRLGEDAIGAFWMDDWDLDECVCFRNLVLASDSVHTCTCVLGTGKSFRETFAARGVNTQALQWDQVRRGVNARVDLWGGRRPSMHTHCTHTHTQSRPSRIVLVKRDANGDREVRFYLCALGRINRWM